MNIILEPKHPVLLLIFTRTLQLETSIRSFYEIE